ncbi:sigma factor-like helix-turn-helix DNA-binding protein [Sphingobium xenophagum]
MPDLDARALLVEALDFLNDHPCFSLRRDRSRTSYQLAARIDAFLAPDKTVLPIVAAARVRWPNAHILRIDPDEQTVQRDGDGYWVRAWVHVDAAGLADVGAAPNNRYAHAVSALPEITRQILLADFLGDEDFTAIAARLGITTQEVEQHIADALAAIAQSLDRA